MFGFFKRKSGPSKEKFRGIEECGCTRWLLEKLAEELDTLYSRDYFEGERLTVIPCYEADMTTAGQGQDFLFDTGKDKEGRAALHRWLEEYADGLWSGSPPYAFEQYESLFREDYSRDDSFVIMVLEMLEYCAGQDNRTLQVGFGVSPWSGELEAPDCLRVYWRIKKQ